MIDGAPFGQGVADQPRGDVGRHGFSVDVATDERAHTVCAQASAVSGRSAVVGTCVALPEFGDLNADGAIDCADVNDVVDIFDLSILLLVAIAEPAGQPLGLGDQ